jgi:acetoacetyl-CoA reductase
LHWSRAEHAALVPPCPKHFSKRGIAWQRRAGNDATAKAFRAKTGAAVYRWDAGDFEACVAGIREVEAAVGAIDVLVNNAGIVRDSTLHKMTKAQWDAVMATDLKALFNMLPAQ